jgi:hypothetical protein
MRTWNLLAALSLMSLAALACGVAGGNLGTPPAAAAPTPSAPLPATEEPELEAVSLLEAVTAEVEPGSAGEAQGVITGLRYLVGELSLDDVSGGAPLLSRAGTGVVRLAQIRLDEGTYAETDRVEIERLLAILLPSRETLEQISRPATASRPSPALAAPAPRLPPETCRDLWASGFTLPLEACLEYRQFTVGDRTYRVHYPSYWPAGHPGRALLDPAFEALSESVRLYNGFGDQPVMSTDVVLMDLDLLVRDEATGEYLRDPSVYAAAAYPSESSAPLPGSTSCRVGVFPSGLEDEDVLRQTLGHELFHCYQYTNLRLEEFASRQAGSEWWVEGSAEFFGSVVYADLDVEFEYLPRFSTRSTTRSLLAMDYDAYPFFLYLAREGGLGPEGVIRLLESMPEAAGGLEAEQSVLAGQDGIEEAFHEFGRAYLDRELKDYNGGPLPLDPTEGPLASFSRGPGEGFFSAVGPFQLKHYRLHFDDDVRFVLNPAIEGTGKHGLRAAGVPGEWGNVPSELNTSCAETDYILLVTGAVPPGTEAITLALATLGEPVDETVGCDECLLGTWELDNDSYLARMGGVWPIVGAGLPALGLPTGGAEVHPTGVFGSMVITFKQDGTAVGAQLGWGIAGKATYEGKTIESQMTYSGTGEAVWRVETDPATLEDYLFFDAGAFDLSGQMVFMGLPQAARPTGGSNDPIFLSSPQPYQCTAATLTYTSSDGLPPVVFRRAAGP